MELNNIDYLPFIGAFLISIASGLLLIPLVRKAANKLGLVDRPGGRKIHSTPTPRIGGLAIYLASLLGSLPFLSQNKATIGLLAASTFVFIIGLIDDLVDINAKVKLAGQIVACLILFAFGVKITVVTDFISGEGQIALGLLAYPLTMLWIIGLTNTINLIDGVDGLAGGIVLIALFTLFLVRLLTPHVHALEQIMNVLVISVSLMGAIIAFLKYNLHPAKIFMGDSGAYFLGFVTAALSVAGGAKGSILFPLIIPLIAFGLPVADVIFAILRRFFKRVPIFQADKEHVHHQLMKRGFNSKQTTTFLWMVSFCFSLVAILAADIPHRGVQHFTAILLTVMVCICIFTYFKISNDSKN